MTAAGRQRLNPTPAAGSFAPEQRELFAAARDRRLGSGLSFAFLDQQVGIHGEVLPWSILLEGFTYQGTHVPLIAPQGIFKPAILDTTSGEE